MLSIFMSEMKTFVGYQSIILFNIKKYFPAVWHQISPQIPETVEWLRFLTVHIFSHRVRDYLYQQPRQINRRDGAFSLDYAEQIQQFETLDLVPLVTQVITEMRHVSAILQPFWHQSQALVPEEILTSVRRMADYYTTDFPFLINECLAGVFLPALVQWEAEQESMNDS